MGGRWGDGTGMGTGRRAKDRNFHCKNQIKNSTKIKFVIVKCDSELTYYKLIINEL